MHSPINRKQYCNQSTFVPTIYLHPVKRSTKKLIWGQPYLFTFFVVENKLVIVMHSPVDTGNQEHNQFFVSFYSFVNMIGDKPLQIYTLCGCSKTELQGAHKPFSFTNYIIFFIRSQFFHYLGSIGAILTILVIAFDIAAL